MRALEGFDELFRAAVRAVKTRTVVGGPNRRKETRSLAELSQDERIGVAGSLAVKEHLGSGDLLLFSIFREHQIIGSIVGLF